jgi:hypothetical protein
MSFDQRIREGLERAAAAARADVERSLHTVLRRRRRRTLLRRVGLAFATAGLAASVAVIGANLSEVVSPDRTGPPAAEPELAGTYEVTLTEADAAGMPLSVAGTWRMELRHDGVAVLSAPETFGAEQNPRGESYEADAVTFRTNVFYNNFCSSVGTYAWRMTGRSLTFEVSDDDCELRRAVLATEPWTKIG